MRSRKIEKWAPFPLSLHKALQIVQYVLLSILLIAILQILLTKFYNTSILTSVMIGSYSLAIIMLGFLAQRFFSWFRSMKSFMILAYGLASAALALNAGFTVVFVCYILFSMPALMGPHVQITYYYDIPGSVSYFLNSAYVISSITSFIIAWTATAFLLSYYSQRIGRTKYWVLVSLPLVYFLSQFVSFFLDLFEPVLGPNPFFFGILFSVVFNISKVAGGALFGLAFWSIARAVRKDKIVRDYLILAGIGFALLFISNQAILLSNAPYPPFGLTTVSFMGLSSYLMLIGLYYSAIAISNDATLRKSIRISTAEEFRLLGNIGLAEMEDRLQKRVMKVVKEQADLINQQTGIQATLSDNEVADYMKQVTDEIKKQAELRNDSKNKSFEEKSD
jgi:hypothetical protein